MTNSGRIPWLKIALPPALLASALFGGRLLDATPEVVNEVYAGHQKSDVQQRHRYIADHLYGVDFFDEQHGIATGYYGTVLRTQNGGHSWSWHTTEETELLRRVHMTSNDRAFTVGHRGTIYRTTDGGGSWQAVHREPDSMLRAVAFSPDGSTGWAVGSGAAILRTQDGGQTWERQPLAGYKGRDLPTLNGLALVDSNRLALAGEFGTVAFSTDGGESWDIRETPMGTTLNDIAVTPQGFLAVGFDGTAVGITQNGDDYDIEALPTGSTEHLFALSVDANGEGVAVGRRSVLRIAGGRFSTLPIGDSVELPYNWFSDIDITGSGALWSVGRRGLIAGAPSDGGTLEAMFRLGSISAPDHSAPPSTAQE